MAVAPDLGGEGLDAVGAAGGAHDAEARRRPGRGPSRHRCRSRHRSRRRCGAAAGLCSCAHPARIALTRCARDLRGGRRFGTRQPRPGRLGVVRRRRLLGLRRLAARHQQHGRADGGPRPAPADRARRRRAARRSATAPTSSTPITKWMAGLEAQGLEEGRRQARDERRADEGPRRRDGGPADRVRFEWVKGHAGHVLNEAADKLANAAASAYRAVVDARCRAGLRRGSSTAHPAATVGQVEQEPDLFSDLDDRPGRWSRPTRSTSSPWSGRC